MINKELFVEPCPYLEQPITPSLFEEYGLP